MAFARDAESMTALDLFSLQPLSTKAEHFPGVQKSAGSDGFHSGVKSGGRGHYFFIKADLALNRVTLRHSTVNLWGVIKVLHVFSGVQLDDARQSRGWALTTVWAYSMDAVAAGLIFMVLSSLYMWWEPPQKRLLGAVLFGLGSLICGLFCIGLRWLF